MLSHKQAIEFDDGLRPAKLDEKNLIYYTSNKMLSHKQAKGLNGGIRPAKLDEKVLIRCLKVCLEISFGSFVEDSTSRFFYLLYCKFFLLVFSKVVFTWYSPRHSHCCWIFIGSFGEDSTSKFFYLLYCKFFYLVFSKDFFICLVCKFFLLGILQDILRLLVFSDTGACRRRL
jgi:hypothetical protein